ncbi:MAG: type II toxin-antitoxin system VapC family toxin [Acidobacteriota bacterium]
MIAVDTSTVIAYLQGETGVDVEAADRALGDQQVALPPVVLCELLSDPTLSKKVRSLLQAVPLLPVTEGYWARAGDLRSRFLASGQKARLSDTLIAQSCIDHGVALITRDVDFRHFRRQGLSVLP